MADLDLNSIGNLLVSSQRRPDRAVLRFGLELSLGFDRGWTAPVRQAGLDVAELYWRDAPDKVDAFQRDGAKRYTPIGSGAFRPYYSGLIEAGASTGPRMVITLLDKSDGTPPAAHQFTCAFAEAPPPAGRADDKRDLDRSNLWASWPVSRIADGAESFVALVLDWCNRLHPEQGHAGIAPIAERGMLRNRAAEYWPFLTRFPGLDFLLPFVRSPLGGGLRGVNWLTIVGSAYVDQLGGREAFGGLFGEGITLHDYDGGVLVQAGPLPDMGDRNRGLWPELYREVNAALRPVRFEDYPNTPMALIKVPEPLDAYQETLDWIRRFDRE